MAKKPWHHATASRHARGYGTSWNKLRVVALRRDCYLCQPCQRKGLTTPATEVDHIAPKAKGGTDSISNVQSICGECHAAKTARESAEAQGHHQRLGFDAAGWPIWPE